MSHHNTAETQTLMLKRIADHFRAIIAEEGVNMEVDPTIADTLKFVGLTGTVLEYAFEHEDQKYIVELTEDLIDGLLSDNEIARDNFDSIIYSTLCEIEDGVVFSGDDEDDEEGEVDLTA